jgi:malate dehydrogenase
MMRLDENRAKSLLAERAGVTNGQVTNLAVYGNHSSTQFPDYENALIGGCPAVEVINDRKWLEGEFLETTKYRGAAVIEKRGLSSAASVASAVVGSVVSIISPTAPGSFESVAVASRGEYGVPAGLQFGFPVRSDGSSWEVVDDQSHGAFATSQIEASIEELKGEKAEAEELLAD